MPGKSITSVQGTVESIPKVVGKSKEGYVFIEIGEILAFRAEGEVVWIVTQSGRYTASMTLQEIGERLSGSAQFRRIHRNALVNIHHVRKMTATTSQRWIVTLTNNEELVASKRQAHQIRGILRVAMGGTSQIPPAASSIAQ